MIKASSISLFKKYLLSIIDNPDYWIALYDKNGNLVGSIKLNTSKYSYPTKKSLVENTITLEKDKDCFKLWISFQNGEAFYCFTYFVKTGY